MSSWHPLIKWLHIVSSTVLFGTGAGVAGIYRGAGDLLFNGGEAATVRLLRLVLLP